MNIAGCINYNGAAAMSTKAALRSGVGLCMLASPKTVVKMLAPAIHETTYLPLPENEDGFVAEGAAKMILSHMKDVTAVCVGSGMGKSEQTRNIAENVIRSVSCPIIIDADGLNSIAANIDILKERKGEIILTPHVKEFSRISGLTVAEIQADRIKAARDFAEQYSVTVVLKGSNTVIASHSGEVYVNICGNSGLAKGGSGDVLTGIIGAMAAQGIVPAKAAACGVYCHALASDILAQEMPAVSMLPCDIIDTLPRVFRS